jgi:hypothetical protein
MTAPTMAIIAGLEVAPSDPAAHRLQELEPEIHRVSPEFTNLPSIWNGCLY